jgi:hypothetical protein
VKSLDAELLQIAGSRGRADLLGLQGDPLRAQSCKGVLLGLALDFIHVHHVELGDLLGHFVFRQFVALKARFL